MLEEDEILIQQIENLLEVYTLEELLELSDVTPVTAIFILYNAGELELPDIRPV